MTITLCGFPRCSRPAVARSWGKDGVLTPRCYKHVGRYSQTLDEAYLDLLGMIRERQHRVEAFTRPSGPDDDSYPTGTRLVHIASGDLYEVETHIFTAGDLERVRIRHLFRDTYKLEPLIVLRAEYRREQ